MKTVRLQKFLAEAGVASRRACEEIIQSGRVSLNGKKVIELGTKVDPTQDRITLDGQPLKSKRKLYLALNKPHRYLCSNTRELNRKIIFDLLPQEWNNLFSVGRLDYESEGLIFVTNDGDFCLRLSHPRYQISKIYIATLEGKVMPDVLHRILKGIEDRGEKLIAKKAKLLSANNTQSVVEIELTEGKNREVRRLFESQQINVKRLQRVKIGPIKLGELPLGKWRALTEPEIKSLLSKL